jgi:hypothetical protein
MDLLTHIRKTAALEEGRRNFHELTSGEVSPLDAVLMQKAGAADPELLAIAGAVSPDRPLAAYENLGGTYTFDSKEGR